MWGGICRAAAIPSVNCVSTSSVNAVLEAAAKVKSPVMCQVLSATPPAPPQPPSPSTYHPLPPTIPSLLASPHSPPSAVGLGIATGLARGSSVLRRQELAQRQAGGFDPRGHHLCVPCSPCGQALRCPRGSTFRYTKPLQPAAKRGASPMAATHDLHCRPLRQEPAAVGGWHAGSR